MFGKINNNPPNEYQDPNLDIKENVYLYEEVVFADEIYLKCIGINAELIENEYELNLLIRVEQWNTDSNINQQIIKPDMFSIKQVEMSTPSSMQVFLNKIVEATLSTAVDIVSGEVNVIEETLEFATGYIFGIVENVSTKNGKVIKSSEN